MQRAVGLDFGGTSVKGGLVSADGEVLAEDAVPFASEGGAAGLLDAVADLARGLGATDPEVRMGVGCAGLFERESGELRVSPNLGSLVGLRLAAEFEARLGRPAGTIPLENDANVAALGEQWLGGARGIDDVLVVTLGTGVGGGLVLGGELYAGPEGRAGEIGHVPVRGGDSQAPLCGCGARGCLEALASATAASRRAGELGLVRDVAALTRAARAADGAERELLVEIGRDLGRGLAIPVVLLDLSCFVFGGGFAGALDMLEPGIRAGLDERRFGARDIRLLPAELGGSAGWIGAARLALGRRA